MTFPSIQASRLGHSQLFVGKAAVMVTLTVLRDNKVGVTR